MWPSAAGPVLTLPFVLFSVKASRFIIYERTLKFSEPKVLSNELNEQKEISKWPFAGMRQKVEHF